MIPGIANKIAKKVTLEKQYRFPPSLWKISEEMSGRISCE